MAAPLLRERAVAGLRTLAKRRQCKRPLPLLHISFRAGLIKIESPRKQKKFCALGAFESPSAIDWLQGVPANRYNLSAI
jgi:hypothetical protein